ncbi:cysteine--tRNA ligase [Litorimonas sp. RW-G-Af-16]|uniref:cysteine--tRNA ligase n=1 Tax=Litorimonas sp. RW-G-Af-16 TaxID=3241168 RepID=UPI003AB03951
MTEQPQLTLYNSLTREKEIFTPQDPTRVTMYNCGPTVYSYAHIGNARAAVVADVLFRVLRHIYGEDHVIYARNITDVDDKIIKAATEQGVEISEITEKFAKIYQDDLAALGCLPPTHEPKATEHIGDMITMISKLIKDGFAYESDGHVFFDVSKYDDYGKLSGNTLDALRGGDRVGEGEVARKKNSADFVLWKPELDGVGWDAPFGRGRPGWHIECSAMAKATLGEVIDIHCGGVDLKFPHHENEIAQSCCANGHDVFAKYWVHNEFLNMGSEKMSKSLGNVTLIHDLLEEWDGEVIRLALLKAHYRSELQWSEDLLRESKAQLDGWYRFLQNIPTETAAKPVSNYDFKFTPAIFDDINTPYQISSFTVLQSQIKHLLENELSPQNYMRFSTIESLPKSDAECRSIMISQINKDLSVLSFYCNLLDLLQKDPEEWFRGGLDYDALVAEYDAVRVDALKAKEAGDMAAMGALFKRSDDIRDQVKAEGIVIESGPDGKSTWRKA